MPPLRGPADSLATLRGLWQLSDEASFRLPSSSSGGAAAAAAGNRHGRGGGRRGRDCRCHPGKHRGIRPRPRATGTAPAEGRSERLRRLQRTAPHPRGPGHPDKHRHQYARQADPRHKPGLDRDHPGREDRLRCLRGLGHPDQHGHQHPRQADPRPPLVSLRDRDHTTTYTAIRPTFQAGATHSTVKALPVPPGDGVGEPESFSRRDYEWEDRGSAPLACIRVPFQVEPGLQAP